MSYRKFIRNNRLLLFGFICLCTQTSFAGVVELSGTFSYSHSDYGNSNYAWSRRWGFSFGYYFLSLSELEFSVQDILYRTNISDVQDTTFHDQIYSVDWVQSLLPKKSDFQPYLKVGIGELRRKASGTQDGEPTPELEYNRLTMVSGVGLKVFFFDSLSLKMEATTYLVDGSISSSKNNFSINGGISVYF